MADPRPVTRMLIRGHDCWGGIATFQAAWVCGHECPARWAGRMTARWAGLRMTALWVWAEDDDPLGLMPKPLAGWIISTVGLRTVHFYISQFSAKGAPSFSPAQWAG